MTTLKQTSAELAIAAVSTTASAAASYFIFNNRIFISNYISSYLTQASSIPLISCAAAAIPMLTTQYQLDKKLGFSRSGTILYFFCTTALITVAELALSYSFFDLTIKDFKTNTSYNVIDQISKSAKMFKTDATSQRMSELFPFNYSLVLSSALLLIAGYARLFYNAFKLKKQLATQSQANETAIQLAVSEAHASRIALAEKAIADAAGQVGEQAATRLHNTLVAATQSEIDAASPASARRFSSKRRPQGAPTSAAAGAAAAPASTRATPAGADTSGVTDLDGEFTPLATPTPMLFSPTTSAGSTIRGSAGSTGALTMTVHRQISLSAVNRTLKELNSTKSALSKAEASLIASQNAEAQLKTQLANEQAQAAATIASLQARLDALTNPEETTNRTGQQKRKRKDTEQLPRIAEAESDAESTTTTERPASGDAAKEPTRKSGRKVIRPSVLSPNGNSVRDFVLALSAREAKQAAAAAPEADRTEDIDMTNGTAATAGKHAAKVSRRRTEPLPQIGMGH